MAQFWNKKEEAKVEVAQQDPYEPVFPEPQAEEPKAELKPETKNEVVDKKAPAERAEPVVLVSENDAYIHQRMREMPQSEAEIDIKVQTLSDGVRNPLEHPKEIKKYYKKYDFLWSRKDKRSLDENLDIYGYNFVNPRFFPDVPRYLFTANGSIERGDLILLFISKSKAESIRQRPIKLSEERVKSTLVKPLNEEWEDRGENYYKPDKGVAENDNEEPLGRSIVME